MGTQLNTFYVYEHWRPDIDVCFWVGKGHGRRAFRFERNPHYNKIVAKLKRSGLAPDVRLLAEGLSEKQAFQIEKDRISFWRSCGGSLANYSDGGEGPAGYRHTNATKDVIRAKRSAQVIVHSDETKRKIGAANSVALKGKKNPAHGVRMRGRKHSLAHCLAIAESNRGRIFSSETKAKISKALTGGTFSPERIENLRISHLGKVPSEQTRKKMGRHQKELWADPDERQKRLAYRADPEKRKIWIESLRNKPPATEDHRRKLSEAAKLSWAKRKVAVLCHQ